MFILLYGEDSYRSRQKLKDIIEEYKKAHRSGLSLNYLEGDNLKFEDFKDEIKQVSMFGEKELLVLSNVFANQDFKEKFAENFKSFSETKDIILFYQAGKILAKDKLLNLLKRRGQVQNFSLLEGVKLKAWLKREFLNLAAEISPEAMDDLIGSVGNDLWLLSNEARKLADYKRGGKINSQDVALLIGPKVETAIFKTIDAISQKNKKQALLLLHQHLRQGDNPLYLLSMISFQFKNLLVVKDLMEKNEPYYLISKKTQLHPFVARKSYQQAGKFSFAELKKIYQELFRVDLYIKTGKVSPETALDLFIAGI